MCKAESSVVAKMYLLHLSTVRDAFAKKLKKTFELSCISTKLFCLSAEETVLRDGEVTRG